MLPATRRLSPPGTFLAKRPLRKAQRLVGGDGVAARAWCTGSATGAGVRSGPWLVGMVLATPAGVLADQTRHRLLLRLPGRCRVIKGNSAALEPSPVACLRFER